VRYFIDIFVNLTVTVLIVFAAGDLCVVNARNHTNKTQKSDSGQNSTTKITKKQKKVIEGDFDSKLARINKVIGSTVFNKQGVELAEIEEIIIDPASGRIVYTVLSSGDLLDFNEKIFVVPWAVLSFNREKEIFVLDISEEELEQAPGFIDSYSTHLNDPEWINDLHKYYKLKHHWRPIP
jgi:sporulation protein YlmC with PRC-barrel domain